MNYQMYKHCIDSGIEWIGKIPKDWKIKKLKYLAEINSTNLRKNTDPDYEFNYLDISNVTSTGEIISFENIIFGNAPSRARRIPEEFDTIISTVRTYLKAICYLEKIPNNLIVSTGFGVLHPNRLIIPKFLYFFIRSNYFIDEVMKNSVGVSYPAINSSDLANIKCLLPLKKVQDVIIKFLDQKTSEIDDLIVDKEKTVELLQEYRQALISETVTKGLNPNVEMKESGVEWIGDIPINWNIIRLKYVAIINPSKNYDNFSKDSEDLVTFLPMERVNEDGTYDTSLKKKIHKLWKGFTYFEENDVIVAKITPCFENKKGACLSNLGSNFGFGSTEFHVLREIDKKSVSKFLYYVTKSKLFLDMGESLMTGAAGQKRVPTDFIKNYLVSTLPIKEQKQIGDFLDRRTMEMDSLLNDVKNQIEMLIDYRQALISEAVTGKMDLRNLN